jgi:hypothetical protein
LIAIRDPFPVRRIMLPRALRTLPARLKIRLVPLAIDIRIKIGVAVDVDVDIPAVR